MVLIIQSVDKILKLDHSVESYRAVLSCGVVTLQFIAFKFEKRTLIQEYRKALDNYFL